MPSAINEDDDDPVVASYDVYITASADGTESSTTLSNPSQKLFLLQYPSHRQASKPFSAARSQKPTSFRLKPSTGMIEVDVPILINENFNNASGENYGRSLAESRISQMGGSHGLAGGFLSGPVTAQNINLNKIPVHDAVTERNLDVQTLGGKAGTPSPKDPIYMLGSFVNSNLYLSQLDSVVQLRPQLHHIDADEENKQKAHLSGTLAGSKAKPGVEASAAKLESRAIELKIKDSKEDPKDRNLNQNALSLREVQAEAWRNHDWVDEGDEKAHAKAQNLSSPKIRSGSQSASTEGGTKQLRSMVSNDDWLDKMSVAREDGKKGLRAKLKGRDRERARRKKVENQRRMMTAVNTNAISTADISSGSEASSLGYASDPEAPGHNAALAAAEVKQEPGNAAAPPTDVQTITDSIPSASTPRKRGRPKKI